MCIRNFILWFKSADLEGKTDLKIRALEIVEELRGIRADKQVHSKLLTTLFVYWNIFCCSSVLFSDVVDMLTSLSAP